MARGAITVKIDGDYNDKDINRAIKDLNALKTQSGATAPAMAGMQKAMLGLGAAAAGAVTIGAITDFLKDSMAAAVADEKSIVSLSKAMDNLGLSQSKADVEGFVKDLMLATGVADDQLRPAYQKLVQATGNVAKAQDLLSLSMDVSAGTGKDLQAVSLALAKASGGNIAALTKLGVPLDANIVKTKNFAAATAALTATFGGQAAAAADTYGGKIARLSTALDEAKETIGYSLLDAIESLSTSIGGTDGLVDNITDAGDAIANFVTGMSVYANKVREFKQSIDDFTPDWMDRVKEVGDAIMQVVGPVQRAITAVAAFTGEVVDSGEEQRRQQQILDASTARWEGLANALVPGRARMLGLADATADTTGEIVKLKTANDLLKASLDGITNRDDVVLALRAVGKAARDAKGDIVSNKDASIDLRAEAGTAASALLTYAQTYGTSAQKTYELFVSGLDDLRKRMVKNRVKPSDVDEFINLAAWDAKFKLLADSIGAGRAAESLRLAGLAAGRNTWQGIVQGLAEGNAAVYAQGALTAGQAAAGARYALQINSPSKVWAKFGAGSTEGYIDGLKEGTPAVLDAVRDTVNAIMDKARTTRDQAMAAMRGVSDSILGTVLGNVDFSTMGTDAEGKAVPLEPNQIVEMMFGDISKQREVVAIVGGSIGAALPPELLQQILGMPPDTAIALANYLGKDDALLTKLAANYDDLAIFTQEALGIPMGLAWAKVGDQAAKEMFLSARELVKARKDSFSQWVSSQLSTSITVDVNYRYNGSPTPIDGKRAAGGPVGPGRWLVGEKGPEIVEIGGSGYVTPNSALSSGGRMVGGGNTYYLTVNAPVGSDARQIGQELFEHMTAFERANGAVYQRA